MKPIRIGVIGLGNMGRAHARDCVASESTDLVAVCDIDESLAALVALEQTNAGGAKVAAYTDSSLLMSQSDVEAVLIATPHYFHTPVAIAAFGSGIHVLCEKPVGVHVKDVQIMIDAYEAARQDHPDLVFAAMFQQRTIGTWRRIKELIANGELGKLVRATWIITTWFRTQRYYDLSHWRATWKGEGGGVLLNQCPHNLDLYQWFFGLPNRVHGFASIAKYHNIEVEDEVTATFEHENGMIGHFITTTAESPGTNRLEIVGELGKLVCEDGKTVFDRNEDSMLAVSDSSDQVFMTVPHAAETLQVEDGGGKHRTVIERFARAVRGDGDLVAEGREGMGSVMLANAVLMSHFTGRAVDLPLDGDDYVELLEDLIAKSTFVKPKVQSGSVDMDKSF